MSFAETAQLVARLSLKDDFSRPLGKVSGSLNTLKGNLGKVGRTAGVAIGAAVTVGAAIVTSQVRAGLDSLAELESATTSVDGAIKQMGLTGQVTSQQIAGWANEIEASIQAAFDDKEITQAATTLIRFGKVTTANIKPALTVIADLATKTGSVDSAAKLLAKALADPTKAAGALRKAGVILTDAQQDQIKAMVKAGDAAGAQKVLLDALAASTAGAAAAMNGPMVDALKIWVDVKEDAQRALATGFIPVLTEVRTLLSEELAKPETLDRITKFGEGLAGGLKGLIGVARGLPWTQIGDSLKIAGAGGKALLDALTSLPPWIQTAVLTGWGLNKLTGGAVVSIGVDLVKGAFSQFLGKGSTPANPLFVSDVTGGLGKGGIPGAAAAAPAGASLIGMVSILPASLALLSGILADKFNNDPARTAAGINGTITATAGPFDPGFWTNLVTSFETIGKGIEQLNKPVPKPDPRGLSEGNKELVDKVANARDAIETARIATVSAQTVGTAAIVTAIGMSEGNIARAVGTGDRDAIEAARIAQVSATLTGASAITLAVQGIPQAIARDTGDAIGRGNAPIVSAIGQQSAWIIAQKAATDRARDAIESSRIALTTSLGAQPAAIAGAIAAQQAAQQAAVDRARDAIESARIANASQLQSTRAAAHSDTDRIVAAINRNGSPKVTVFVDKGDAGSRPKGGKVVNTSSNPTGPGHPG